MWRRTLPPLEILDEEQLERLEATAFTFLEEIGVRVTEPRASAVLRRAGLEETDGVFRFDRAFVAERLASAPREFTLYGRDPVRDVVLGGDHLVIAPTGGAPFVWSTEGERRPATMDDYVAMTKVVQAASPMHMAMSGIVEPADLPVESRHLDMDLATIRWSTKPYFPDGVDPVTTRDSIELAAIAFGGREAIAARPPFLGIVNPISPLQYDVRMGGSLFELATAGQAVVLMPYLLAGATAPLGLAGAVAQAAAEVLAGTAFVQEIRPRTPVVYGTYVAQIDLHHGTPIFGTGGAGLAILAAGQMARWIGLPFRAGGAFTQERASTIRAAQQSMNSLWPTLLAGANLVVHGAGWLEGSLEAGLDKIAEDVEALEALEAFFARELPTDDEALSLDALREAGPGGVFLGTEHTLRQLRAGGHPGPPPGEAASWERLLEAYEDPGLDEGVTAALEEYVAKRKAELKGP